MNRLDCKPENALKFRDWLANRGGIAVWKSVNLSDPNASWSTPALTETGQRTSKPSWQSANEPAFVITKEADVDVLIPKEYKRFHVAVRHGAQGLTYKLTDAATKRLRAALASAGEASWYEFDFETQDAIIYVPAETINLTDFNA